MKKTMALFWRVTVVFLVALAGGGVALAQTAGAMPPAPPLSILVGDDDGIESEGIIALAGELSHLGDLTVVAPLTNHSGAGHAVTTEGPIKVKPIKRDGKPFGYGVTGTPVTAIMLGLDAIMQRPPDVVVSGVNEGHNMGQVIYTSGTFGVAREAVIRGIPGIAVSLERGKDNDFGLAAKFTKALVQHFQRYGFPRGVVVNVNVPACKEADLKGVMLTKLSDWRWHNMWYQRADPFGNQYYWNRIRKPLVAPAPGSDAWAVANKMISVSLVPLEAPSAVVPVKREFDGFSFLGKALVRP